MAFAKLSLLAIELPPGRLPVATEVVPAATRRDVYRRMYVKGIEIYAFKEGVLDADVQLRAAMLKQVA